MPLEAKTCSCPTERSLGITRQVKGAVQFTQERIKQRKDSQENNTIEKKWNCILLQVQTLCLAAGAKRARRPLSLFLSLSFALQVPHPTSYACFFLLPKSPCLCFLSVTPSRQCGTNRSVVFNDFLKYYFIRLSLSLILQWLFFLVFRMHSLVAHPARIPPIAYNAERCSLLLRPPILPCKNVEPKSYLPCKKAHQLYLPMTLLGSLLLCPPRPRLPPPGWPAVIHYDRENSPSLLPPPPPFGP